MKSQNTKSSDELNKEVRHEIRNVRRDIDELQSRLSPGQLIDDVIFYPHGKSPAATFDHLKRNPVGTAFLSLGTILLMEDESHQSLEAISKSKVASVRNKMNMHPTTKELAIDKMNEFRDKMDELKSEVEYKMAAAQDKISSAKGNLENALPETPDVASLKSKVSDKIHNLDSTTFMALGAGLGILTGASLPVSETERSLVDNKLQDKLSGFSADLQSAMNECSNILKDLVVSDVKDFKINLF